MTTIHEFKQVTEALGIYPNELGAVMLDFDPINDQIMPGEWEYYSPNQEEWWIKGWVGHKAHLTLRHGLLKKGYELADEIAYLTKDLQFPSVNVIDATHFIDPGSPYAAIVLKVAENPLLMELHRRLSYLPHIDTYTPWVPHVTVAYVHADHALQAALRVNKVLYGRVLNPRRLNLGEDTY